MIKKLFRQMLVTQVLSAMTVMICMLIDSIMIGRFLAQDAMTAYGLASPVLMVFAAVGSMMTAGIQVICGRTVGSGDREGTNVCFSTSLIIAGTVSLVGLAVVFSLTGPIGVVIGAEGDGVSRLVREKCDFVASIPRKGPLDSLNASVAAGVLMYEIVRQRG